MELLLLAMLEKNYRQVICLIPIDDMGVGDKRQPRLRPVDSTLIISSSGRYLRSPTQHSGIVP